MEELKEAETRLQQHDNQDRKTELFELVLHILSAAVMVATMVKEFGKVGDIEFAVRLQTAVTRALLVNMSLRIAIFQRTSNYIYALHHYSILIVYEVVLVACELYIFGSQDNFAVEGLQNYLEIALLALTGLLAIYKAYAHNKGLSKFLIFILLLTVAVSMTLNLLYFGAIAKRTFSFNNAGDITLFTSFAFLIVMTIFSVHAGETGAKISIFVQLMAVFVTLGLNRFLFVDDFEDLEYFSLFKKTSLASFILFSIMWAFLLLMCCVTMCVHMPTQD